MSSAHVLFVYVLLRTISQGSGALAMEEGKGKATSQPTHSSRYLLLRIKLAMNGLCSVPGPAAMLFRVLRR